MVDLSQIIRQLSKLQYQSREKREKELVWNMVQFVEQDISYQPLGAYGGQSVTLNGTVGENS